MPPACEKSWRLRVGASKQAESSSALWNEKGRVMAWRSRKNWASVTSPYVSTGLQKSPEQLGIPEFLVEGKEETSWGSLGKKTGLRRRQ